MLNCNVKYLIDTNVFIQAKNLYYRFDFCEQFWAALLIGHQKGIFYSTQSVKRELFKGDKEDLVRKWLDNEVPDSFFVDDINNPEINKIYASLMIWASTSNFFSAKAVKEFAEEGVADARLIATAKALGYTIVSQEKSEPERKNKILIPEAAKSINAQYVHIYDMLSQVCACNFSIK